MTQRGGARGLVRGGGFPHGGGVQGDLHEDLHAAVLRLREALVQQREAALELAAKLGRCEARAGGHLKEGGGSEETEGGGGGEGHEEAGGAARGHAAGDAASGTANQQRALQGLRQRLQQLQVRKGGGKGGGCAPHPHILILFGVHLSEPPPPPLPTALVNLALINSGLMRAAPVWG